MYGLYGDGGGFSLTYDKLSAGFCGPDRMWSVCIVCGGAMGFVFSVSEKQTDSFYHSLTLGISDMFTILRDFDKFMKQLKRHLYWTNGFYCQIFLSQRHMNYFICPFKFFTETHACALTLLRSLPDTAEE